MNIADTTIAANNNVFNNLLTLPIRATSNGFVFNSSVCLILLTILVTTFANKMIATAIKPHAADQTDTQLVVSCGYNGELGNTEPAQSEILSTLNAITKKQITAGIQYTK